MSGYAAKEDMLTRGGCNRTGSVTAAGLRAWKSLDPSLAFGALNLAQNSSCYNPRRK